MHGDFCDVEGVNRATIDVNKGRLLGAHCSTAGGIENAPLVAQAIGANALQLFTGPNQRWRAPDISQRSAAAFLDNVCACGIRAVVAHAGYLINLASPDDEIREKSIAAMIGELGRAEQLRIPHVVVHPGSHRGAGIPAGIARAAESIAEVLAATRKLAAGIALENTAGQGNALGGPFEEIAEVMRRAGDPARLRACFDTCHAFAAGHELRTAAGFAATMAELDRTIGIDRLVAIHLNDCKGALGSRLDRHDHIGKGQIGIDGFRHLMRDERLANVPMLLETPKEGDAVKLDRKNLALLRTLIGARHPRSAAPARHPA